MSRFSFEKFLSHSAGKFRREPFCALIQKTSGSETVYGLERGEGWEYHNFLPKTICLTLPKTFVGEPSRAVFRKYSGSEKLYG